MKLFGYDKTEIINEIMNKSNINNNISIQNYILDIEETLECIIDNYIYASRKELEYGSILILSANMMNY